MNSFRPILGVIAVIALALSAGCASNSSPSETAKSLESLSSMRTAAANTQAQVDRVLGSLNSMSTGNDLANSFKAFDEQVAELRKSAEEAAQRATTMKEKKGEYIARWQRDMESDANPAMKDKLEQRKAAVAANFESAQIAGQGVRQAFGPFNQTLRDIHRALSKSLTPQTVAENRPTLDQARFQGRELKNRLINFGAELDRMQSGLASPAPAK